MSKELDKRFVSEDRKVAFIIDHYPARTKIEEMKAVELISMIATLLQIDEEIAASGDKQTKADMLGFIREEFPSDEEEKGDIEIEKQPPECPASFRVDRAVRTLQQFVLFCDNGVETREMVEKTSMKEAKYDNKLF